MASLQVVLQFVNPTGYGWSEGFWYSGPNNSDDINTNVQQLVTGRAAILTSSCMILRARIATGTLRNPFIISFNDGQGTPGTETPPTTSSEVALLAVFQADVTGYNRAFLRGIPERVVQADSFVPDSTFSANMHNFFNVLLIGPWNAVGSIGGDPTRYPISDLVPTPPRGYVLTVTSPGPTDALEVGDSIRVGGTKVPGFSGLKTVTKVGPGPVIDVNVGGAAPAATDTGVAPYFTIPGEFDDKITNTLPIKITRRGAGRPFGLIRGRRQTLYSLRQ
jgi:hypothetical protein